MKAKERYEGIDDSLADLLDKVDGMKDNRWYTVKKDQVEELKTFWNEIKYHSGMDIVFNEDFTKFRKV